MPGVVPQGDEPRQKIRSRLGAPCLVLGYLLTLYDGRERITTEIEEILGNADRPKTLGFSFVWYEYGFWSSGPNWIEVYFENKDHGLSRKTLHLATLGETLQWYANKGAEKIGIEWQ